MTYKYLDLARAKRLEKGNFWLVPEFRQPFHSAASLLHPELPKTDVET